jgi:hypothetical protein
MEKAGVEWSITKALRRECSLSSRESQFTNIVPNAALELASGRNWFTDSLSLG